MIGSNFPTSKAASAYAGAFKLAGGAMPVTAEGADSFINLLSRAVGGVSESGRRAESVTAAATAGAKPDLVDVVTAIAESESALETLVSIRDKVLQAYEDIMRMPI